MVDEKVLVEALSSPDFKLSAHEKKQTDQRETEVGEETNNKFGEDANLSAATSESKKQNNSSLLSLVKSMFRAQCQKVIDVLKENGFGDPLTKEKLIQNAFTVDKTIREQSSHWAFNLVILVSQAFDWKGQLIFSNK